MTAGTTSDGGRHSAPTDTHRGWPVRDTCSECRRPVALAGVWTSDNDATYVHVDPVDSDAPERCYVGSDDYTASTLRRDLGGVR